MKRITKLSVVATAASVVFAASTEAQNIRAIEARVISVEQRLAAIESKLADQLGGSNAIEQQTSVAPPAPPVNETYVIRDGDSVGGIARKFGIPRQVLLEANEMTEGEPIYIGETLVIPAAPVQQMSSSQALEGGNIHIVASGDTLTGIARKYGSSVGRIKEVNNLNSDIIGLGQKLVIPSKSKAVSSTDNSIGSGASVGINQNAVMSGSGAYQYDNPLLRSDETYGYYAVQKGDNLYALARDFFTTMKEIQRLNRMGTDTIIHPGTELIVPTSKYNAYHQKVAQN